MNSMLFTEDHTVYIFKSIYEHEHIHNRMHVYTFYMYKYMFFSFFPYVTILWLGILVPQRFVIHRYLELKKKSPGDRQSCQKRVVLIGGKAGCQSRNILRCVPLVQSERDKRGYIFYVFINMNRYVYYMYFILFTYMYVCMC